MTRVLEAIAFLAAVAVPVLLGLRLLSPLGKKPGPIGEAELLRSGVHFGYRVWQDRVRQGRLTPVRRKAA
jgi:hypothetical protein